MEKPVSRVLSPKDLAWLKKLDAEIWQVHDSTVRANLSGHLMRKSYRTENRKLIRQEFKRLERLIRTHELPCLPGSGVFGFGFSLTVCSHSESPGVKPEALIVLTGKHLPSCLFGEADWNTTWAAFLPFTHSPRNRELLAFYGFDPPREREYYEY
jgi:hypothetical protein